jgi:hypothetical protein
MSKTSARRHRRSRHARRARARALAFALAFIPICLGLGWWSAYALRGAAVAVLGDAARAPEAADGAAIRAENGATRADGRDDRRPAPARTTSTEGAEGSTDTAAAIAIAIDLIPTRPERAAAITADAIGLPVLIGPGHGEGTAQGEAGRGARDGAATDRPPHPTAGIGAGAASSTVGGSGVGAGAPAGVAAGSGLPVGGPEGLGGLGGLGMGPTAFANVPGSGSTAASATGCPPGGCPVLSTALSGQALARTAELTRSLDSSDLEALGGGAGGRGDGDGTGAIHRPHESAVSPASEPPPAPLLLSKVDPSDPTLGPLFGTQDPDAPQPVPAPPTALLLLAGAGMLLRRGRRPRED